MALLRILFSPILYPLFYFVERWQLRQRHAQLKTDRQLVATYRCSIKKPPVVHSKPVELFYRPRTVWIALQIVAFTALAFWTVKNYVAVLKSL
jgi:hypothetical protein